VKIFVAVPNLGTVATGLMLRLMQWMADGIPMHLYPPENVRPHHRARNLCHREFINSDCTHLLWIDADTIPPRHALRQLLDDDRPVVSAVVQAWKDGGPMVIALRWNDKRGGYVPHYGAGVDRVEVATLACCLIERRVMEQIGPRAFAWEDTDEWGTDGYGEDFVFFRRLARYQIPVHVDYRLLCTHHATVDLAEVNHLLTRG